jgi:hypothetical protein
MLMGMATKPSGHGGGDALLASDFKHRRSEQRTPLPARVISIIPCKATKNWAFLQAEVVDCSTRGLGLIVPEELNIGEQFLAKLKLDRIVLLIYEARHCQQLTRRNYRVGAEFVGLTASRFEGDPASIVAALVAGQH